MEDVSPSIPFSTHPSKHSSTARVVEVLQFIPAVIEWRWFTLRRRHRLITLPAHRDKQPAPTDTKGSLEVSNSLHAQASGTCGQGTAGSILLAVGYQQHLFTDRHLHNSTTETKGKNQSTLKDIRWDITLEGTLSCSLVLSLSDLVVRAFLLVAPESRKKKRSPKPQQLLSRTFQLIIR